MMKKVLATIHSQKIDFPSKFVCVHSQRVAVCSCSYLVKSRTKALIKNYTSTSCEEEVGVFVKISCLTQRKHLLQLHTTTLIEFQILQLFNLNLLGQGSCIAWCSYRFQGPFSRLYVKRKIVPINWGKKMCEDLRLKLGQA